MKRILIILGLLVMTITAFSQSQYRWNRYYGTAYVDTVDTDSVLFIIQTETGQYAVFKNALDSLWGSSADAAALAGSGLTDNGDSIDFGGVMTEDIYLQTINGDYLWMIEYFGNNQLATSVYGADYESSGDENDQQWLGFAWLTGQPDTIPYAYMHLSNNGISANSTIWQYYPDSTRFQVGGNYKFKIDDNGVHLDTISEYYTGTGVTIEGVSLKNGVITNSNLNDSIASHTDTLQQLRTEINNLKSDTVTITWDISTGIDTTWNDAGTLVTVSIDTTNTIATQYDLTQTVGLIADSVDINDIAYMLADSLASYQFGYGGGLAADTARADTIADGTGMHYGRRYVETDTLMLYGCRTYIPIGDTINVILFYNDSSFVTGAGSTSIDTLNITGGDQFYPASGFNSTKVPHGNNICAIFLSSTAGMKPPELYIDLVGYLKRD